MGPSFGDFYEFNSKPILAIKTFFFSVRRCGEERETIRAYNKKIIKIMMFLIVTFIYFLRQVKKRKWFVRVCVCVCVGGCVGVLAGVFCMRV